MSQKGKTFTRLLSFCAVLGVLCIPGPASADKPLHWTVSSPDKSLTVVIAQQRLNSPYMQQNNLYYKVELNDHQALPFAPLGFIMGSDHGNFVSDLTFVGEKNSTVNEIYSVLSGKKKIHQNHANQKTLIFKNNLGTEMHLVFRACDDGIAWRYHIPGSGPAQILNERSAFRLPANSVGWLLKYTPNYEGYYDKTNADDITPRQFCFPALFHTPAGIWVLCTEAAVYGDYAGSHLLGSLAAPAILSVEIPQRLGWKLPWSTPWRVAIVSDTLAPIVESVIVENLNPACELKDTGWIEPGVSTFPWWSDPFVNGKPERLKQFIDFAADMGFEWLEFDVALIGAKNNANRRWMTADWVGDVVRYAADKGVSVYGWDSWKNLDSDKKREKLLSLYNQIGLKGIKIDYLDSDRQQMFQFRDAAVQSCAKHKLMVSFHGATIPRGQQRRWPHIMTWEGVIGSEYYQQWGKTPPTPQHNCTLPFTRNAVGPMDYTPTVFSAERKQTTNAHELALSVIFESGWQNIADKPESIAASGAKPFLKNLPNTWDDTHFIAGQPGEFVCLARRKANDWYIAAINAEQPRTVKIPLDFLKEGIYSAALYCDDDHAKAIAIKDISFNTNEPLEISVPPNGGFCLKLPNSSAK